MPDTALPIGNIPIGRVGLQTSDIGVFAELFSATFARHRARFRRIAGTAPDASIKAATAGPVRTGITRMPGLEYDCDDADSNGSVLGVVALEGHAEISAGPDEHRLTSGGVWLAPPHRLYAAHWHGLSVAQLQLRLAAVAQMAEACTGLPEAGFRFESMAPVSKAAAASFAATAVLVQQLLLDPGREEINALVARELARLTAAALLETFPSNAMRLGYVRSPGWMAPSAAARAAEFMQANATLPITLADIAGAAGVSANALQHGFRRHFDTTPLGYLRKLRLEHARLDLQAVTRDSAVTVAAVGRKWGWATPARFTADYLQHHGQLPQ